MGELKRELEAIDAEAAPSMRAVAECVAAFTVIDPDGEVFRLPDDEVRAPDPRPEDPVNAPLGREARAGTSAALLSAPTTEHAPWRSAPALRAELNTILRVINDERAHAWRRGKEDGALTEEFSQVQLVPRRSRSGVPEGYNY